MVFVSGYSQVQLSGSVSDSMNNPLTGANIIAIPLSDALSMEFSISDQKGRYRLNLKKDSTYVIELSYLGYQKISDTLRIKKNITKNYMMLPSNESLDEIVIEQKMAVLVREDTVTYRTQIFKTGEERKLREVLKKLPGVEVDRDGNVTVNGKKVDKLMVDGKTFFTGDTKLAIENIPADVVDEVEVLDNYSEVPFLKGLEDSDKMAMNIKLSAGKKEFIFGDIEIGAGHKARYLAHPTLFFYSPKTSVNLIGDFNNNGERSFSMKDYVNFEGGILSLMDNPDDFDIYNDDFSNFLQNDNFTFSKNHFGALNIVQKVNKDLDLNAYTIASWNKMEMLQENEITYLEDEFLTETRTTKNNNDLFFSLNKIQVRYTPNLDEDFTYDAFVKISDANGFERINSNTQETRTYVNSRIEPEAIDFMQNLKISKQFSLKHTTTATLNYKFKDDRNYRNWIFDRSLFNNRLPLNTEDETYELLQKTSSKINKAVMELRHYWVLNNTNHIYPIAGISFYKQNFSTQDAQILNNDQINDFTDDGFNNDLNFKMIDQYAGIRYKLKLGKFIFKPGILYRYYSWDIHQFNEQIKNDKKLVFLPELEGEYKFLNSEKIRFKYKLNSQFSDASNYANRLRILSFNRLFQGEENLENQLYHSASLSYYKFNLFKGVFLNATLSYTKRLKSVRTSTSIDGIDQINTAIYTSLPEESYSLNGSFSKKIKDFKITLNALGNLYDYSRIINENTIDYRSENLEYTFKTETSFENLPNLELGIKHRFNAFKNTEFKNVFEQIGPYGLIEYDFLNSFILKADYEYNLYKNKTSNETNHFKIGRISLFYNKEDSPWGFEIDINNVFDVRYKRNNTVDDFVLTDRRIFIQPRTALLKISYKI